MDAGEFLSLDVHKYCGINYQCACGRNHSIDIDRYITGRDIIEALLELIHEYGKNKVFMISDVNTYEVLGRKVFMTLQDNNLDISHFLFKSKGHLIPDEKAIGRLMVEIEDDVSLLIAVGSGVINDITRYMSFKFKIPYLIAATAPSMDGYASVVSPLIIDGKKTTIPAVYPKAILAGTNILREAPFDMIRAGFGDLLGKITAISDWKLSSIVNNEHFCAACSEMVLRALEKCMENISGITSRNEKAIAYLMDALVLSGFAIGMYGNSRPASGSEHHLAHYWEMDAIAQGTEIPLHGNSVGVGAYVMASLYNLLADELPKGIELPDKELIKTSLESVSSYWNPKDYGLSREFFEKSLKNAMYIRERYTLLRYAYDKGLLDNAVKTLSDEFYGRD